MSDTTAPHGFAFLDQASHMLCDGIHPHFDCSPAGHLLDVGDLLLPNTGLEPMRAALARQLPALLAVRHMGWLGGDHSVTLPILRALKAQLGRPPAVVHFDAQCDTWEDHFGEPGGHGTWVCEAIQEGLVLRECFKQLGTRPAGLTSAQLTTLVEEVADLDIVDMDRVEVAPPYDHAELTSAAAAACVWAYLSGRVARRSARQM